LSARTRKFGAGATFAGAALGLVALAAQVLLPALDVYARTAFALVVGAAAALAALLNQRRRSLADEADATSERQRSLDDLLACSPPPRVRDANAYDLGSVPFRARGGETPPPPYVARDSDATLFAAFSGEAPVVVMGEPGVGKSRSAFAAVSRARPNARLLVPEGGDALARLLQLDLSLVLGDEEGVLWIDALERYLTGLRVDALDALRHRGVLVVLTVRSQTLRALLEAPSEEGRAARRLVARAAVVEVPSDLSEGERAAAAATYPGRAFDGGLPMGFAVWPCAEQALHMPVAPPAPPPPRRLRDDWTGRGLMVALTAIACALVYLLAADLAFKPAPLADQLADARDEAAECSATEVYPPKANDDVRTYALIVRGSRGCNRSDELRILRVRDGELRSVYDFQPQRPPGGFYRLVCRGADASSPCTVRGAGTDPAIVAGWADTASGIVVPFVVQRRGGRYAAQGIERAQVVDEEDRAAREARARYRREVVLRSSGDPPIEGYPVEDFAVVVVGDTTQLVRGLVWRGTFDAPAAIEVSAAELILPDATLASCSYASGGLGGRLVFRVRPRDPDLAPLLRTRWTAAVRAGDGECG